MPETIPLRTGTGDLGTRPSLDGKIPPAPTNYIAFPDVRRCGLYARKCA